MAEVGGAVGTSGESAAAFARHVGTNAMTLYRWRRELRDAAQDLGPRLAKIVEVRRTPVATDDRFEVRLGDDTCIWGILGEMAEA